jgi:hypothetical protein
MIAMNDQPSKGYTGYWKDVIYQRRPGGNWTMKVQHNGQRRKLSLQTPVKADAATRARNTYLSIIANGWKTTLPALKAHGWVEQNMVPIWL